MLVQDSGNSWFFISAGLAFGEALERDATDVIRSEGGSVVGGARHPFGAADFSSPTLLAANSKAKVIGLANAGQDMVGTVKQINEFGVQQSGVRIAALLAFITDIKALGLDTAKGLYLTESFYWDLNEQTRKWSQRFYARNSAMPTMNQAGTYSAVMHYLRAVNDSEDPSSHAVMKAMRALPVHDLASPNVSIRADGRVLRDMYVFQVKSQSESKGPWDLYKLVKTIPFDSAFRPLKPSDCFLVNHLQ
jgi:branched-chain amino acid transport system substrate-binding protein